MTKTKQADIEFIMGRRGSGKTTRIRNLIKNHKRLVIYDPTEDFPEQGGQFPMKRPKPNELATCLKKAAKGAPIRIAYTPPAGREVEEFDQLCKALKLVQHAYKQAPQDSVPDDLEELLLVVDEAHIVYGHGPNYAVTMDDLIRRGRHWGISIIAATLFATEVRPDVRRNAARTTVFPVGQDAPALKYAADCLGGGKEWQDKVRALKAHTAYIVDSEKPEPYLYKNPPLKGAKKAKK